MLGFLPPLARGVIALCALVLNTLFWCALLFCVSLVKLAVPVRVVRRRIDWALNAIASRWIACNSAWMRLTQRTAWEVTGVEDLRCDDWHLVNCNHQSWVDIFVLQHVLNRRIPLLKFFLKHQLIYVPVIGLAWWALDFPFMRRHSKAALKRHPELRLQDRDTARRACAKFALAPTSVMNFPEGTRFTQQKHRNQASPYRYLLKPKAGALALAMNAMGAKFRFLLDVTIVYPGGTPTFWQFLCGRTRSVIVHTQRLPIPAEFCTGDYDEDAAFRGRFHRWLADVWDEKDRRIEALLAPDARVAPQ